MFWLLLILQMMSGFVAGESAIRKYPEGDEVLRTLSKSGLFFLKWRAFSNYKKDLLHLRNIFGISLIIFGSLLLIVGPTKDSSLFNMIPGIFLILWLTLQFGTNFKKGVAEQFSIVGILMIGPWLFFGLDIITDFEHNQLRTIAMPFNIFQIQKLDTYQITILLSLGGGVFGILFAIISIVILSIIPLVFLFLIVMVSIISRTFLNVRPIVAYYIAVSYCFFVGPLLIALESKGII